MPLPTQTVPRVPGEQEQGDPTEAEGITLSSHSAQELPVFLGLFILAIITQSSSSSCPLKTQTQSSVQPQHSTKTFTWEQFSHISPQIPAVPRQPLELLSTRGQASTSPEINPNPPRPPVHPARPGLPLCCWNCRQDPVPRAQHQFLHLPCHVGIQIQPHPCWTLLFITLQQIVTSPGQRFQQ